MTLASTIPQTAQMAADRRTPRHGAQFLRDDDNDSPVVARETGLELALQSASLVEALQSEAFMPRLWSFLDELTGYDNSCVYLLSRAGRIVRLGNRHDSAERAHWHAILESSAFVLSPYHALARSDATDGFYPIAELAPDDFFESEYFSTFYFPAGCKDEAVFVARIDAKRCLVMTLERLSNTSAFAAADVQRLKSLAPLICALLRKHWRAHITRLEAAAAPPFALSDALTLAFQRSGRCALTEREREVASLILRGHSSKSAARVLCIAAETERVHRKRLYAKLSVSSQAELFSLFLDASLGMQREAGRDFSREPMQDRS